MPLSRSQCRRWSRRKHVADLKSIAKALLQRPEDPALIEKFRQTMTSRKREKILAQMEKSFGNIHPSFDRSTCERLAAYIWQDQET